MLVSLGDNFRGLRGDFIGLAMVLGCWGGVILPRWCGCVKLAVAAMVVWGLAGMAGLGFRGCRLWGVDSCFCGDGGGGGDGWVGLSGLLVVRDGFPLSRE